MCGRTIERFAESLRNCGAAPMIVREAIAFRPLGLIQFGLLLLIATPVARVLFSVLGFALERDWMYVMITLLVLALLIYTLTSGVGS